MNNLIKAELYRQKFLGIFKMLVFIMICAGAVISITSSAAADSINADWFWCYNNLIANSRMVDMAVALTAAMYFIKDFNDKTLQHAIASDFSRKTIVFAKAIVFNIQTFIAFLTYILSGMITALILNGTSVKGNYSDSIIKYVILTLIFKLLYLAALSSMFMCFCYIVRNYAAFLLLIFTLWASFLGTLYKTDFVTNSNILKTILKFTICVQDQLMFVDRLSSGVYKMAVSEMILFLLVAAATILVFYYLTCRILDKVEIG